MRPTPVCNIDRPEDNETFYPARKQREAGLSRERGEPREEARERMSEPLPDERDGIVGWWSCGLHKTGFPKYVNGWRAVPSSEGISSLLRLVRNLPFQLDNKATKERKHIIPILLWLLYRKSAVATHQKPVNPHPNHQKTSPARKKSAKSPPKPQAEPSSSKSRPKSSPKQPQEQATPTSDKNCSTRL